MIIWPPDIVVGGLRFYRDTSVSSSIFSFVSYATSSLNRTQPKPATCSDVNANWKFMSEMWGIAPTNRGPKNHQQHDINNRANVLVTTRGLLHLLKTTWTLVQKRLKIGLSFLPILRKFCVLLHCQASLTEISKQNSTKLCQTVGSKSI